MPYLHCNRCHHEWEGNERRTTCDWCGGNGYVLEEQTPLEKMCRDQGSFEELLEKLMIQVKQGA